MKNYFFFLFGLVCLPAYAYIGPGTGAGIIASVLGVLGSFILIIVGLVYYPIKRMLKKRKQASESPQD